MITLNILVVSENFTKGGLETHIHSYYMCLRRSHHFVFAFRHYDSKLELDQQDVYTGFHFGWNCSVQNFVSDIERLVRLIQEHSIDIIHIHPFHSIFPAVVAGQLAGIPIVCTHHGTYCFAFPSGLIETLLLRYAYTELVDCVFSVSSSGRHDLEKRIHVAHAEYMPNALDTQLYRQHTVASNRQWAMISRIDGDCINGIKTLVDMLPQLPVDGIDIYGAGTCYQELEEYVAAQGLTDRVRFIGWQDDLYNRLDGKYSGLIGQGRVAMEGLVMGYPVLEMGYGRVCGLLYGQSLAVAKDNNFVANLLPRVDGPTVAVQMELAYAHPEKFNFRHEMMERFNIQTVAQVYENHLSTLIAEHTQTRANIFRWFHALQMLPRQEEQFYTSWAVFQTIVEHIKPYVIDQSIQDLFILGNYHHSLEERLDWLQASLDSQGQYLAKLDQLSINQQQLQTTLEEQSKVLEQQNQESNRQAQMLENQIQRSLQQAQSAKLQAQTIQQQAQKFDYQAQEIEKQTLVLDQQEKLLKEQAKQLAQQAQSLDRQMQLLEQQAQTLAQQGELLEHHNKVIVPLLWLHQFLSRIKRKIKEWFH